MLGINSWAHDPGELKAAMSEFDITWRPFDDDGSIFRRWNSPATPTFYIIDHEGTIRKKWIGKIGDTAVDSTLNDLILEAGDATRNRR